MWHGNVTHQHTFAAPQSASQGPLIDLNTALAIASQFARKKRSKRSRSPASVDSGSSSDSERDVGGDKHRPSSAKEHALAYFLDNMEGVKLDAPCVSLDYPTFWPPVLSKPGEHEAATRGRLSGYATLSVTTRSKDKKGKSVFSIPDFTSSLVTPAIVAATSSLEDPGQSSFAALPAKYQPTMRTFNSHVNASANAFTRFADTQLPFMQPFLHSAFNRMVQRGCTAAFPLFREFIDAAVLELGNRLCTLEHRVGVSLRSAGQPSSSSGTRLTEQHLERLHQMGPPMPAPPSGRKNIYVVPPGYSLPRDKVLCAPCAHLAIHQGSMKATDPPVAEALHTKDPTTKAGERPRWLAGECNLTKAQRQQYRHIQ
jgi:hypothetical protein